MRQEPFGKLSLDLDKFQDPECFQDMKPSEAVEINDISDGINQTGGSYLHDNVKLWHY